MQKKEQEIYMKKQPTRKTNKKTYPERFLKMNDNIKNIDEKILKFTEMINKSNNIVFFGGAGVSTESGIPDFRSKDGLYNQKYKYPPEMILSHSFFMNYTEEFYKFYKDKMNSLNYEPNITHKKLAELENKGKVKAVVTQNIDGLHQKAGSKIVYELHRECAKKLLYEVS